MLGDGFLRHAENVLRFAFIHVFGIGALIVTFAREKFGAVLLKSIGDVFKEDEPEDDVLVFRRAMLLRSSSAMSQSLASRPMVAVD